MFKTEINVQSTCMFKTEINVQSTCMFKTEINVQSTCMFHDDVRTTQNAGIFLKHYKLRQCCTVMYHIHERLVNLSVLLCCSEGRPTYCSWTFTSFLIWHTT